MQEFPSLHPSFPQALILRLVYRSIPYRQILDVKNYHLKEHLLLGQQKHGRQWTETLSSEFADFGDHFERRFQRRDEYGLSMIVECPLSEIH
jgi:hypothetical protein